MLQINKEQTLHYYIQSTADENLKCSVESIIGVTLVQHGDGWPKKYNVGDLYPPYLSSQLVLHLPPLFW